jgi:hypothetical protein
MPESLTPYIPVLSALGGAIAGGFLTQLGIIVNYFLNRNKDRLSLYRDKLEQAYLITEQIDKWIMNSLNMAIIVLPPDKYLEFLNEINSYLVKLNLIISIYFSDYKDFKDFEVEAENLLKFLDSLHDHNPGIMSEKNFDKSKIYIDKLTEKTNALREALEKEIKKYI